MDNYFSLETVADILSKSKFTIESWQKSGKLIPELDPAKYDKPYSLEQLLVFDEFKELANSKWVGYWQGNHREGELLGMKAFAPNEISSHYFKRLEEQAAYDEILMAA